MTNFVVRWAMAKCDSKTNCDVCTRRKCKPRKELSMATGCSEHLVGLLQYMHEAVTHPNIADRIADYIGATSEERDEIVAKKHHGTYAPGHSKPPIYSEAYHGPTARSVVVVNKDGEELDRFETAVQASYFAGVTPSSVLNRCRRRLTAYEEFSAYGISFRFTEEWDAMTPEQRALDLAYTYRLRGDDKYEQDG